METMEIKKEIAKITDTAQLKDIYKFAFEQSKTVDRTKADMIGWRIGQSVRLKTEHQNRKPYDTLGIVKKVNQVKLKVTFGEYNTWNVPKTMLEAVE